MALGLQGLNKSLFEAKYIPTRELRLEKELREEEGKKALSEVLPELKVKYEERSFLGIKERKAKIENYQLLEELFENYSPTELYYALKDLEKSVKGELREKIKAIRKEVGKREGIYSKKRSGLIALGVLGAGLALGGLALWLSQDHKAPEVKEVEYKDRVNKGEAQEISVKVFEENPGQAYLKFNSTSVEIPLAQKFENGTALYKASFDLANVDREGLFSAELIVRDKAGNEARQSLSFLANLQAPLIKDLSVEKIGIGKYKISLSLEEQNLKEAYVLANGRKINLTRSGDKFNAQVDLGCSNEFEIRAEDVFGLSASLKGEASLSEADKLELSLFCSSNLFREIYSKDKSLASSILRVAGLNSSAVPKNLAYQVLEQIERDESVQNKWDLAKRVFSNLNAFNAKSLKLGSIWLLNNATNYGFQSLEGLEKALHFSESSNVDLNFTNRLIHSAIADIGHYFPQIFKYPQEARWLSIQVGDCVYLNKIDKIKGKDYVWDGLIIPYTKWRFERLENGSFQSLDYKLSQGELAKLAEWADIAVVNAAARSLYPIDEIMNLDLMGREREEFFAFSLFGKALEVGVRNMSYNSTLGDSPFGYIYKLMLKDMEEKGERYQDAYLGPWKFIPHDVWTNTGSFWLYKGPDGYYHRTPESLALIGPEPEIAMIKGYPAALSIYDPPMLPNFYLPGQYDPYLSKIIGAMLNRAVVVLCAPYPDSHNLVHDEPFVVGKDGKLVGFWYKLTNFLDDYNPEKNPEAKDDWWKTNKPWILLRGYGWQKKFEYHELSKVLNG